MLLYLLYATEGKRLGGGDKLYLAPENWDAHWGRAKTTIDIWAAGLSLLIFCMQLDGVTGARWYNPRGEGSTDTYFWKFIESTNNERRAFINRKIDALEQMEWDVSPYLIDAVRAMLIIDPEERLAAFNDLKPLPEPVEKAEHPVEGVHLIYLKFSFACNPFASLIFV